MKFITYREETENGLEYFILQKGFPHFVCKISDIPEKHFVDAMPITAYNLFLVFNFTLRGNLIPSYQNIDEEIKSTMQEMAAWFYEQRIINNEKKYKKWKL